MSPTHQVVAEGSYVSLNIAVGKWKLLRWLQVLNVTWVLKGNHDVQFLRFSAEEKSWFISDNDCFGTDECFAKCEVDVCNPAEIQGEKHFFSSPLKTTYFPTLNSYITEFRFFKILTNEIPKHTGKH